MSQFIQGASHVRIVLVIIFYLTPAPRLPSDIVLASSAGGPGSIPSQGPRHTKDVIKIVPVVPLFSTQHSKGKILALSQE